MPVAAALASCGPLWLGAGLGHLDRGLVAAMGGLLFLYLPATPWGSRMATLGTQGLSMVGCYAVGELARQLSGGTVPLLALLAAGVCLQCRRHRVGPPGALFFVLPACVAAYAPAQGPDSGLRLALFAAGAVWAWGVAAAYSLDQLRRRPPAQAARGPALAAEPLLYDALILGWLVGLSLLLAQWLGLARPYWAPVSCLVVQGATLRLTWDRQLQRLLGTGLGMLLAWGLLQRPLDAWTLCALMTLLTIAAETAIVRHYGLAVVFITPLTIFLAEAAHLGDTAPAVLVQTRFWGTLLGCWVGLAGAGLLHSTRCRQACGPWLARLATSWGSIRQS